MITSNLFRKYNLYHQLINLNYLWIVCVTLIDLLPRALNLLFKNFKTVCKILETYGEIDEKPLKNAVNISGFEQTILKLLFCLHFQLKYLHFTVKMHFQIDWIGSEILTERYCVNSCFPRVYRQFLGVFSIFLKTVFSAEIPINRDRITCI